MWYLEISYLVSGSDLPGLPRLTGLDLLVPCLCLSGMLLVSLASGCFCALWLGDDLLDWTMGGCFGDPASGGDDLSGKFFTKPLCSPTDGVCIPSRCTSSPLLQ